MKSPDVSLGREQPGAKKRPRTKIAQAAEAKEGRIMVGDWPEHSASIEKRRKGQMGREFAFRGEWESGRGGDRFGRFLAGQGLLLPRRAFSKFEMAFGLLSALCRSTKPATSHGIGRKVREVESSIMKSKHLILAGLVGMSVTSAHAVVLVQTLDPGYYNNNLGTILNLSNGNPDDSAQPFPVFDDSTVSFPTAPDISAASGILGNWLTTPGALNSNWSGPMSIPNSWTPGNEVAVIYKFDTLGAQNVVAKFGVDNGIYAWLDGNYIFGARAAGGVGIWDYTLNLGDFAAGTHYLQLLLEDHGGSNGYAVEITADTYTPAPVPDGESTAALCGLAFGSFFLARRKRS